MGKKAYECMLKGNNVFISGEAGTGKSYVGSRFINEMSQIQSYQNLNPPNIQIQTQNLYHNPYKTL